MVNKDNYLIELGKRINICAKHVGGKRSLSNKTDISETQLFRYIKGEQEPSITKCLAISKQCNIDLNWLITGEGQSEPSDQNNSCNSIDEEVLQGVIEAIEGHLDNNNLELDADKKAQLITIIYNEVIDDDDEEQVDLQNYMKYIKLAT